VLRRGTGTAQRSQHTYSGWFAAHTHDAAVAGFDAQLMCVRGVVNPARSKVHAQPAL
jgi:hypothetical protein